VPRTYQTILSLPGPEEEKTDRQFITALARGLEVLRAFEPGDGLLGNLELAKRTGLPKPTIARITHTLTTLGYLEYNARLEKYSLGTPVLALGYACLSNMGISRVAKPHMQELANFANCSVALGNRDRLKLAYLELAHGSSTVSLRLEIGARIPIARSAMGAAYLHALPESEREFLVEAIRKQGIEDFPAFTARLERAFDELDKDGFCVSLGVFEKTVNGVGAALRTREGGQVFAFNCSGPSFQFGEDFIRTEVGPRLVQMVRNIESELNHRPILG
jgi:DNA-binding IclR family transcriptional regulator